MNGIRFFSLVFAIVIVAVILSSVIQRSEKKHNSFVLSPGRQVLPYPVLRGAKVNFQAKFNNRSENIADVIDAETSCGCANLTIAGEAIGRKKIRQPVIAKIESGLTEIGLDVDTGGKPKGVHDFQYAFQIQEKSSSKKIVKGLVTVDVRQGLKIEPSQVIFGDRQNDSRLVVLSDFDKVTKIERIEVSDPELFEVNFVPGGTREDSKDFVAIGTLEVKLKTNRYKKNRGQYDWIDCFGDGPEENVFRVLIRSSQEQERKTKVIPRGGVTLLASETEADNLDFEFLISSKSITKKPEIKATHILIKDIKKVEEGSWRVYAACPTRLNQHVFQLEIVAGDESIPYKVKLVK